MGGGQEWQTKYRVICLAINSHFLFYFVATSKYVIIKLSQVELVSLSPKKCYLTLFDFFVPALLLGSLCTKANWKQGFFSLDIKPRRAIDVH